tara:strand:- start:12184 stop:12366 length:183 start_codon:yes stop_codon:yes gene_type:complete
VNAVAIIFAMLPDTDVIGFRFGIDYADGWDHRGASHIIAVRDRTPFCAAYPDCRIADRHF